MISVTEFSKKIKQKYPQYKDMDDYVLAEKIVKKYPAYADQVDLKKKEEVVPSVTPVTPSVEPSVPAVKPITEPVAPSPAIPEIASRIGQAVDDPIGASLNPIKNELVRIRTMPVAESTAQSAAQREARSRQVTDLLTEERKIEKDAKKFFTGTEAEFRLNSKLDKSKLVMKEGVSMQKPVVTLDDYTPESISEATNKQNLTDQVALDKYLRTRNLKEVLSESPDLETAAIKSALKKGGLAAEQIRELSGNIPSAMKANLVSQLLSDKDLYEIASKDANLTQRINEAVYNFPQNYPSAAVTVLASLISDEREKEGYNNAILNVTSESKNDEIVDKLVSTGKLPIEYKNFYERPEVRFIVNNKLKTSGLVENVVGGLETGVMGFGKSLAELTGARSLYKSKKDVLYEGLAKQYENFRFKPKGLIHEITTSGGNVVGQFIPIALGGNALMAAKIVQNPTVANSIMIGLQAYGENKEQAEIDLAGKSAAEKEAYALINTGIEVATENILNDVKLAQDIAKGYRPQVKNIINKFTAKEISAAAAEKNLKDIFADILTKSGKFAAGALKISESNAREEVVANVAQNLTRQIFTGEDMSITEVANQAFDTWKTSLLGGLLLGVPGGISQMRTNPASQQVILEIAQNPDYYKSVVEGEVRLNPEMAEDAKKKIENIDYAGKVYQALQGRTDLTYKQKQKFLATSLNEKILKDAIDSTPDKALVKKEEEELKNIQAEKERILTEPQPVEPQRQFKAEEVVTEEAVPAQFTMEAPRIAGEPEQIEPKAEEDAITVGEMIDRSGNYRGSKGQFYLDGRTVIFKPEGKNVEYELGDIEKIKNEPINNFEIEHEDSVVTFNEKGNVEVRGVEYVNNFSNPMSAINRNENGEVVSVNLETVDGGKRTFRGNVAEDLAYQITLKEINKNNETRAEFEEFINADEPTRKEVEDAGLSEAAKEKATTAVTEVSREKIEPAGEAQAVTTEAAVPRPTKESISKEIADLRAKEQAEYAAMPDPNDKAKRKEIYDRYDKLITPLLEKEKALVAPQPAVQKFGVGFAPFREKNVFNEGEDVEIRNSPDYKLHQENVQTIADGLGIKVKSKLDTWGGYVDSETGKPVQEVSNIMEIEATPEQARVMAAILGKAAPEMQDSVLIGNYNPEGAGLEHIVKTGSFANAQEAIKLLKDNGLQYFSVDKNSGDVIILDLEATDTPKIVNLVKQLNENGIPTKHSYGKVNAEFINSGEYDGIIEAERGRIGTETGFDIDAFVQEARGKYEAIKAAGEAKAVTPEAAAPRPEKTTSEKVSDDLLAFLGMPARKDVKFSKIVGTPEGIKPVDEKEAEVVDQMNKMSLVNSGVDLDAPSTTKETINVEELNSRLDTPLETVEWSDYEGVPFTFTISDQLRSGDVTNPSTGEVITDLKGGIGFNGTKGNEGSAWANTSEDEAKALLSRAQDVYNSNRALFERLWAEGKLPDGHIPVAVVKMAESSILSNEAVFRVGIQNVKTLPEKNRKKALSVFKKSLKEKSQKESNDIKRGFDSKTNERYSENTLNSKKKKIAQYKKILDAIEKNQYNDIVEVLEDSKNFSLPEKAIITNEVFYGNPTPIGGKPIDISRSRPSTPVSVALIGKNNPELINIGKITDLLTEPSMKNVPSMHVVSIVAVNVKNPEVQSVNHPNYPYGVKGKSIGILGKPVHMKDAFGEAYGSAISQVTKNEADNKSINIKQAIVQGVPVQAGLPNRIFKPAIARNRLDAVDKLSGFLRQAFPSTTFFTSQEAWESAMADPSVKKKLKDGEVVYAFTSDGNVYLNPNLKTTKAALHETGHIWMGFVKENNPDLHDKGLSLVDGTKEFEKAKQQYGDTPLAREEALMELMSSKGDTIVNASQKAKFKEWLVSLYKYISENFKSLIGLSPKDVENITLDQFINGMLADILSGKEITTKKIKGEVKLSAENIKDRVKDFIKQQRDAGVSEADIRSGIENVASAIGITKEDVNNLIAGEIPKKPTEYAVQVETTGEVPVQPETRVGEEVEGGVPPTKPPKPPKEGEVEGEEGEGVRKPSGIKKALVSQEILAKVNLEKISDKELIESGRKIIESGEVNPQSLVNKIVDENKGVLTPAETVALITYKADLDNKQVDLVKEISRRRDANEDMGTLLVDLKTLQTEIDNFDIAAVITANQQSMSFRLRRYLLDRAYNISVQIERYKQVNNGVIPEEIEKKFREMDAKIKDLESKLREAEKKKYEDDGEVAMENIINDVEIENEFKYTEDDLNEKVKEGVQREIDKIYNSLPKEKQSFAQRAITALENIQRRLRSKTYDASLGIPVAVIDAGITGIKNAIKLGIKIEKAVEIGIKIIKDKLNGKPWPKENEFRNDMIDGFKQENIGTEEASPKINEDGTVTIPNKLLRKLVSDGITDIDDLTKAIKDMVQPQLPNVTDRQIRDYITGYGKELGATRPELVKKIGQAKRIGKLLSQLEDLAKMSKAEYALKYLQQKPSGRELSEKEKDIRFKIREISRDLKKGQVFPATAKDLENAKARIRLQIEELQWRINNNYFEKKPKKTLPIDIELARLMAEKEKIKLQFDEMHALNERKNRKWYQKVGGFFNEIFSGLSRALVTGVDLGVVTTQGIWRLFTSPKRSSQAIIGAFKQLVSESAKENFESKLRASGAYGIMKNSGLALTVGQEKQSVAENLFVLTYINAIWDTMAKIITLNNKPAVEFIKKISPFKASQRFFDAYINIIRVKTFNDYATSLENDGYSFQTDPEMYKSAAEFVNTTTFKGTKNIPNWLGFIMFSASKVAAELKLFTPYAFVYYAKMPAPVRKRALLNFGRFALTFMTTHLLLKAANKAFGCDEGDDDDGFFDIRSSNFLTFRFCKQRFGLGGGIRSILVFQGRFISGEYRDQFGEVSKLGERPGKQINTRLDLAFRYFAGKAAPIPAAAIKKMDERLGIKDDEKILENLVLPMWLQDSKELYKDNPAEIGALFTLLGIIGFNVRTVEAPSEREQEVGDTFTWTERGRKREIKLTKEQAEEYQNIFEKLYDQKINKIKDTETYKMKKGDERLRYESMFTKKAKTDAMNEAKKKMISKYAIEFYKFPYVEQTSEEKELEKLLK